MNISRDGQARLGDDDLIIYHQQMQRLHRLEQDNAALVRAAGIPAVTDSPPAVDLDALRTRIHAAGRWYRDPLVSLKVTPSSVTVRIDDGRDPALWADIVLTPGMLAELLRAVLTQRRGANPTVLAVLASIDPQ